MNFTKYLLVLFVLLAICAGQRVQAKAIADRLTSKNPTGVIENKGQWNKEGVLQGETTRR